MGRKTKGSIKRLRSVHGGNCHLCSLRIPKEPNDPLLGASRDHIVPFSEGGKGGENLRLAHIYCNNRRGSGPMPTAEEAKTLRAEVAQMLREAGHKV